MFYLITINFLSTTNAGQCRLPKIPRHLHGSASRRAPHKIRRLQRHGPKPAQRRHPPGAPERLRHALDAEPPAPRRAASRAPRARRECLGRPELGRAVHGDRGARQHRQGVGLPQLEGRGAGVVCARGCSGGGVEPAGRAGGGERGDGQCVYFPNDPAADGREDAAATVPHTPDPAAAAHVRALCPVPGCIDNRARRRAVECACPWRG